MRHSASITETGAFDKDKRLWWRFTSTHTTTWVNVTGVSTNKANMRERSWSQNDIKHGPHRQIHTESGLAIARNWGQGCFVSTIGVLMKTLWNWIAVKVTNPLKKKNESQAHKGLKCVVRWLFLNKKKKVYWPFSLRRPCLCMFTFFHSKSITNLLWIIHTLPRMYHTGV